VQNTEPLIMLPVPTGSMFDLRDTGATINGWGIFAGTSAACPQVAGVVALIREKKPTLSSDQIRRLLIKTAIDVKRGQSARGDAPGPGWDRATGGGFVNAKCAWLTAVAEVATEFCGTKVESTALT